MGLWCGPDGSVLEPAGETCMMRCIEKSSLKTSDFEVSFCSTKKETN